MMPKLILGRPKIMFDIKCPKCKKMETVAEPIIETECPNCKSKFSAEAEVSIFYAYSKKILQMMADYDEFSIVGMRDNLEIVGASDLLTPRSKYEDDIYHTLLAIRDNLHKQGCYDYSEIMTEYDYEYKTHCSDCGYCNTCVMCLKCKNHYEPKEIKSGEKRYTCPECGSKRYSTSIIKFKIDKDNKRTCPHCGSDNVTRRKIPSDKKICPCCGSKSITTPRKLPIYKLVVRRQERHKIENIKKGD